MNKRHTHTHTHTHTTRTHTSAGAFEPLAHECYYSSLISLTHTHAHTHTHTHTHIHTPTPQSYLITLKKITGTQFWQLPTIPHTGGDKPWSVLEGVTPA